MGSQGKVDSFEEGVGVGVDGWKAAKDKADEKRGQSWTCKITSWKLSIGKLDRCLSYETRTEGTLTT